MLNKVGRDIPTNIPALEGREVYQGEFAIEPKARRAGKPVHMSRAGTNKVLASIDEAIEKINSMAHPLAVYVFTSRGRLANKVMERCDFGGGCINDTLVHLATSEMGFGGFGESGMGSYHGKTGFDTFTHYKSIVDKKTWLDLPIRYQPYKKINNKLLHMFLK